MNLKEQDQLKRLTAKVMMALGIMLAVVACMAAFGGCYANKTSGHLKFPAALLPDAEKIVEVDPDATITLQFKSSERVFGTASAHNSKKDISFDVVIPGFMEIRAKGSRAIEDIEVDAGATLGAAGAAAGLIR